MAANDPNRTRAVRDGVEHFTSAIRATSDQRLISFPQVRPEGVGTRSKRIETLLRFDGGRHTLRLEAALCSMRLARLVQQER
jgi:hypothetical protein